MRTRRAIIVAFACGTSALGCSLLTPLDGLTGGAAADDAGGAEAAAESGIVDPLDSSRPSTDAVADAGTGEGGASPCAGAILCDDFERDDVAGSVWASAYPSNGGTLRIASTVFTSPTRSLAAFVPAAGDPHAQLNSVAYPDVAHVRVAFSMMSPAPDRQMSLLRLQLTAGNLSPVLDLFMQQTSMVASEQGLGATSGPYLSYPITTQFKANTWQRWSIEIDARGTAAIGIVAIDGVEVVHKTLTNTYRAGSLTMIVGMFYAPDGPAHEVFYDDLSITILP